LTLCAKFKDQEAYFAFLKQSYIGANCQVGINSARSGHPLSDGQQGHATPRTGGPASVTKGKKGSETDGISPSQIMGRAAVVHLGQNAFGGSVALSASFYADHHA
jgi:hypothetical protein